MLGSAPALRAAHCQGKAWRTLAATAKRLASRATALGHPRVAPHHHARSDIGTGHDRHAGMTHTTKAVLLALSLVAGSGCGGDEPSPVLVEPRLAMKCTFAASSTHAMPGEPFLYLLYDATGGAFAVHGLARAQEELASDELGLWGDLPPHTAVNRGHAFTWTVPDAYEDEEEGFVGTARTTGELFSNIGSVPHADTAYPYCFAREL